MGFVVKRVRPANKRGAKKIFDDIFDLSRFMYEKELEVVDGMYKYHMKYKKLTDAQMVYLNGILNSIRKRCLKWT